MKRKIKMVEQTEHSECGLACATMILNYEGINISLNEIRDTFGVPRGGISLYHLIQVMTAYGIKCKAYSQIYMNECNQRIAMDGFAEQNGCNAE